LIVSQSGSSRTRPWVLALLVITVLGTARIAGVINNESIVPLLFVVGPLTGVVVMPWRSAIALAAIALVAFSFNTYLNPDLSVGQTLVWIGPAFVLIVVLALIRRRFAPWSGADLETGRVTIADREPFDVAQTQDVGVLLADAADRLSRAASAAYCMLFVLESGELRWVATGGPKAPPRGAPRDTAGFISVARLHELRAPTVLRASDPGVDSGAVRAAGLSRFVAVPLRAGRGVVGLACLDRPGLRLPLTLRRARLLAQAGALAALAVEGTHVSSRQTELAAQLRERSVATEALLHLGNDLRAGYELDDVLRRVCQAVVQSLGFAEAGLYLHDEQDDAMVVMVSLGGEPKADAALVRRRIPMRVFSGFLRDEFRIGNSYYRSMLRSPTTAEEDESLPYTDLGERNPDEWQSGDCLYVPLLTRDSRLMGVIDVYDPADRRPPKPETIRTLELFANQAAVAIDNAIQYEQLQAQGNRLERQLSSQRNLLKVNESMLATLEQGAVFDVIADQLKLLLDFDDMSIDKVDWETGTIHSIFARDEWENEVRAFERKIGEGLCGWVAAHGEALLLNEAENDPRGALVPGTPVEPQASIILPLKIRNEVIAVLSIDRLGGRVFLEEDFTIAKLFAGQAAVAIQNAELYEQIQQRAIKDSLTGLYNHGDFQETLAREVTRSARYEEAFSLIMLDLDHFKTVNDRFGHPEGDRVLRRVADAIRECSREADYAARYGGEEFVVILPRTSSEDAHTLADRIRIEINKIAVEQRRRFHVAASAGVADFPACGHDAKSLIAAADQALLWVKRHGRNRVAYFGALLDAGDLVPADDGAPKASAGRSASTDGAPQEPAGRA
jgi:diguanylate cyclase (GGDEF)-like protein